MTNENISFALNTGFDTGKDNSILYFVSPAGLDEQKVYEVQSKKIILEEKYFIENFFEFIKENYKIIIVVLIILLIIK